MAPVLWLPLTLTFILLFFTAKSMVYFLASPSVKMTDTQKKSVILKTWLW